MSLKLKTGAALISLGLAFPNIVNAAKESCGTIHANYINAVTEFLLAAETILSNADIDQYASLKNAISNAVQTITAGDYTYPTLIKLNKAIQTAEYPPAEKIGIEQLANQTTSAGTRQTQWTKASCSSPQNWGCQLGQAGTKCGAQ